MAGDDSQRRPTSHNRYCRHSKDQLPRRLPISARAERDVQCAPLFHTLPATCQQTWRALPQPDIEKKKDFRIAPEVQKIFPATSYSPVVVSHSTIAAEALHCRVRNGNGCYFLALSPGKNPRKKILHREKTELTNSKPENNGQDARLISTGKLNTSLCVHIRPIKVVVFNLPLVPNLALRRAEKGNLILEEAWRLDAFSAYPFRT